jgi:16S rRNA (guanine1207-N2)-methyltransferase
MQPDYVAALVELHRGLPRQGPGSDRFTRELLKRLPALPDKPRIADLGCGNGALSLALALRRPAAAILGVDESYQAVASARHNAERAALGDRELVFAVGDGLMTVPDAALDLVVCNPPFHQDHTLSDQTAWAMFQDARRALRAGGRLLVVGNRHLGHQRRLARLFAEVRIVADDGRFVVAEAGVGGGGEAVEAP